MPDLVLSKKLLEFTAHKLCDALANTGSFWISPAEQGGAAAVAFGFDGLAKVFERLLQQIQPKSYWRGVFTNIPYNPLKVPKKAQQLMTLSDVNEWHPVFTTNYNAEVLRPDLGEYMVPCIHRDYQTAFAMTGDNEFISHEVILAQAMNGDLVHAEQSAAILGRKEIVSHVFSVLAIEYCRLDDRKNCVRMLRKIQRQGLCESTAVSLAFGFGNRVPWYSYPFADY